MATQTRFRTPDGIYHLPYTIRYYSERYGKRLTVPEGESSDGATGAFDIASEAWWCHDRACRHAKWDDGSPIDAEQAAYILHDVLRDEGRWARQRYWRVATYLFGCLKPRKNGGWLFSRTTKPAD